MKIYYVLTIIARRILRGESIKRTLSLRMKKNDRDLYSWLNNSELVYSRAVNYRPFPLGMFVM